ncbi:hypothetical protein Nepgr_015873 [Nepenthes gracilis]|uniref:Uncharacterized protein n=1 Tax=Nepenthes gracilis TaxID=150966 RepID=A0AAD3SMT2_NEPGR|nr:hypothetical protein Nepgr_015873 [Nepenthes gracilis]
MAFGQSHFGRLHSTKCIPKFSTPDTVTTPSCNTPSQALHPIHTGFKALRILALPAKEGNSKMHSSKIHSASCTGPSKTWKITFRKMYSVNFSLRLVISDPRTPPNALRFPTSGFLRIPCKLQSGQMHFDSKENALRLLALLTITPTYESSSHRIPRRAKTTTNTKAPLRLKKQDNHYSSANSIHQLATNIGKHNHIVDASYLLLAKNCARGYTSGPHSFDYRKSATTAGHIEDQIESKEVAY